MKEILELINIEKDLENLKIELTLKDDFNLIDAFGLLDYQCKGMVSAPELRESLQEIGLKVGIDEIDLLFSRYNRD